GVEGRVTKHRLRAVIPAMLTASQRSVHWAAAILVMALTISACGTVASPAPAHVLPTIASTIGPVPSSTSAAPVSSALSPWQRTGALRDARFEHTATRLADGRVLVVGGWQAVTADNGEQGVRALTTAELFDPSSRLWSSTGGLHHARTGHVAVILGDGRVLVIGGSVVTAQPVAEPVRTPEVFDPKANAWTDIATPPVPVVLDAIRLADGRVLAMGFGAGADQQTEHLAVYDPA